MDPNEASENRWIYMKYVMGKFSFCRASVSWMKLQRNLLYWRLFFIAEKTRYDVFASVPLEQFLISWYLINMNFSSRRLKVHGLNIDISNILIIICLFLFCFIISILVYDQICYISFKYFSFGMKSPFLLFLNKER